MKLKIKTYWMYGRFPYHAIETEEGEIICKLMERNYSLACKLRKVIEGKRNEHITKVKTNVSRNGVC